MGDRRREIGDTRRAALALAKAEDLLDDAYRAGRPLTLVETLRVARTIRAARQVLGRAVRRLEFGDEIADAVLALHATAAAAGLRTTEG